MRAPETEATGTAGASEVAAEFQRLGWGATENARHDLGTDLFLEVRDERRFDLGLIGGGSGAEIPMGLLGELVEMFNERFGAELSDADAVRPVQHLIDKAAEIGEGEGLRAQALGNRFADFERGKEGVLIDATLQVKDVNDAILQRLLDDETVRAQMTHLVMRSLYDRYTGAEGAGS